MKHTYFFVFVCLGSLAAAFLATEPWVRVLWVWAAVAYGTVAIGYFQRNPGIFGKHLDGSIPLVSLIFFAPYLTLYALLLSVFRLDRRHKPFTEIAPELQLGCRLQGWDRGRAAPLEIGAVLDVTAECVSIPFWREAADYLCLPTLDATAPTLENLRIAVEAIDQWKREGKRVYIHCAFGHGRSATVMAAYLLHSGVAASVEESVAGLKSRRPGVHLSADQWATLRQFASEYDKLTV